MTGGRRTLWLHPNAATEVAEAVRHYDTLAPRLGQIVLSELRSVARRILACPTAYPEVLPGVRATSVTHLPQRLLFTVDDDAVVVLTFLDSTVADGSGRNG